MDLWQTDGQKDRQTDGQRATAYTALAQRHTVKMVHVTLITPSWQ